jgi:murein L,D-transpeptidase YafK
MRRGDRGVSGFSIISRALALAAAAVIAGCAQAPPPAAPPMADRVVVHKSTRTLELLRDGRMLASFPVALGRDPFGPKQQQGDGKTPEGIYHIDYKSLQSRFTRALHVSYPDDNDSARAQATGVDPGGAIFVHGMPNEYGPYDPPLWQRDWTEGCIAVGNVAIVKIWDTVPDGTPIEITP